MSIGDMRLYSRRLFMSCLGASLLSAKAVAAPIYGDEFAVDPALMPPVEAEGDFDIEQASDLLPKRLRRQQVTIGSDNARGSIIVDPENRYLYLMLGGDQAMRYGVGVGREGFAWSGEATIGLKRRWPRWVPPAEMVERDEKAREWANGMPGGPDNPLGARALYLYDNGQDTLYRIHGTNEPNSIGKAVSSGCIRMLNEDIAHLYDRVQRGTPVTALASSDELGVY